jgi:hypothetical protein
VPEVDDLYMFAAVFESRMGREQALARMSGAEQAKA